MHVSGLEVETGVPEVIKEANNYIKLLNVEK